MNQLSREARAQILSLLCEGMSIRAITRITGAGKNTVARLLIDAGVACSAYQDRVLRNLPCKRVQVDEIWSFVYAKAKNVKTAKAAPEQAGDIWTWTAICADTKLAVSWLLAHPAVSTVIVGARTPAQIDENVRLASWQLTAEERDEVAALVPA